METSQDQCTWTKNIAEFEEDSEGNIYGAFYIETECEYRTIVTEKEGSECPFCGRKILYNAKLTGREPKDQSSKSAASERSG